MSEQEHFNLGQAVEVLTKVNASGKPAIGKIGGPLQQGKYLVEYYPGIGSGHHAPNELRKIDSLRRVDWNHRFWA